MFRKPQEGNSRAHLFDDQYEYSHAYMTRKRRMLSLRGVMLGLPQRSDSQAPFGVIDDIIALNIEDPKKPIYLNIDSIGGDIGPGLALYDTIKLSKAPIITIGYNCSSMAVNILAAGTERFLFPHSKVMMHLLQAGIEGNVEQIRIRSDMLLELKDTLVECYIQDGATANIKRKDGKEPTEAQIRVKILKDIDQEFWLDAKGAFDYGLADRLVTKEDLYGV